MHIRDFDFELPPALIAQQPLPERDASRLLVLERSSGRVRHQVFRDLPDLLSPRDLVVVNRSRVIPARLLAQRGRDKPAEILLVRHVDGAVWDALLRPGRRIRSGDRLAIAPDFEALVLETPSSADGRRRLELRAEDGDWRNAIERHGHVPLPPYVERADTPSDRERYQSVYAREAGSVAAPTAGLHFTPELLSRLAARDVETAQLVLHVGPGTFRPVKVDDVSQHRVDAEAFDIPRETADAISRCRARGGRVVAVGTTTTRTLESSVDLSGNVKAGAGDTDLVLLPGHRFRVTDVLLTNFHLPRSSLLLLVSAFAGRERVLAAYAEAVRLGYRFYSYGDAMLVLP